MLWGGGGVGGSVRGESKDGGLEGEGQGRKLLEGEDRML